MTFNKNYILCILILIGAAGAITLHHHFHTESANLPEAKSTRHDNRRKIPLRPLDNRSMPNHHHRDPRDDHPSSHPSNDIAARLKEFQEKASSRTFATLDKENNLSEDVIKNAKISKGEEIILNRIFDRFHDNMLNSIKNNCVERETTVENGTKYYNYEISPYLSESIDRITELVSDIESTIGKDRGEIVLSGYPLGMNYLGSGQYRVAFSLYKGDADSDGWRCKYKFTDPTNESICSEGVYNFDSPNNNALAEVFEIR